MSVFLFPIGLAVIGLELLLLRFVKQFVGDRTAVFGRLEGLFARLEDEQDWSDGEHVCGRFFTLGDELGRKKNNDGSSILKTILGSFR